MTEREHALAIRKAAVALARACAAEATRMAVRDRLIRAAIADGVSHQVCAIAANVNKVRISHIRNARERRDQDPPKSLGIIAINSVYPCHPTVDVRFKADESMDPGTRLYKRCPSCRTGWKITRSVLISTDRGRLDELEWAQPTLEDVKREASES
jgi:hypothetical protein